MNEIEKIKAEIERTEETLSKNMLALEEKSRALLSPAHHIQQHPLLAAGICFGLGIVLGSSKNGLRKSMEPIAVSAVNLLLGEIQRERNN